MTGKRALQIHPSEWLIARDGSRVEIDTEMVPLIRVLWALGLTTTASCQDFGEGTAGQRRANPHAPKYGGDAFIGYYTGYAWLKMPLPDAQRLGNMLLSTEFHDRVALRWTPGSWRMHIPLVFDQDSGVTPDDAAQIHFPRYQIASLTATLESIPARPPSARVT
jgi:hypothetical protein